MPSTSIPTSPINSEENIGFAKIRPYEKKNELLGYYPDIQLNCDMFNMHASEATVSEVTHNWRNVIIPVNENVVKRITRIYFESGFKSALDDARSAQTSETCKLIAAVAEYLFKASNFVHKLKIKILPHLSDCEELNIAKISETREWKSSYIRYITWHPSCFKIAVAGNDDLIRIYTDTTAVVPVLKSCEQKWITSMAWRPFTTAELAVGCQRGICLWNLNTNLHITWSASQTVFLNSNHSPVTSLAWNYDGSMLATASINYSDVLIWNVDKRTCTPLKRLGSQCSILKWSPDGSMLFSGAVDNIFHVWSTYQKWRLECWSIAVGRIQSACWSPCGCFLLFVTTNEPVIYRLDFLEEHIFKNGSTPKHALPVVDLTKLKFENCEIGSLVQAITWDPNGKFLAVTFKETKCITIFSTHIQSYCLNISPLCVLSGTQSEYPVCICFQSTNQRSTNSVLTVGWSSGRVEYVPLDTM